jgi:hypothetical protein
MILLARLTGDIPLAFPGTQRKRTDCPIDVFRLRTAFSRAMHVPPDGNLRPQANPLGKLRLRLPMKSRSWLSNQGFDTVAKGAEPIA